MNDVSKRLYAVLMNKDVWQLSYTHMLNTDKYSTETIDTIMSWLSTGKYEQIAKQLCKGTFEFGIPTRVEIAKSESNKKRVIYKYTEIERYIMRVLYRAITTIFADKISARCFSYKQGVCTLDALNSILNVTGMYGVKLDIHAYFNSVSREYLYKCIKDLFDINNGVGWVLKSLYMDDRVIVNGEQGIEYKALIPGTAISSFFANYCLRDIDEHFDGLGISYARYSDDIILFDTTAEKVKEHIDWLLERLSERGLTVNESKYHYFAPNETVEFLGLRFGNTLNGVDISSHSKDKIKRTFKRWCKKARKRVEMQGVPFEVVARQVVHRFNARLYKTYVNDTTKFGWAYYAFRYITDTRSLQELDVYCKDTLRYLKTGKYSKANKYALSEEEFRQLGYVSFVEMYELFKLNFGYYCDVVTRI